MSAAEKLRTLADEGALIAVGLDTPLHEAGGSRPASVVLRNALPQIVAVVEAAEAVNHGSAGWPLMLQQLPDRLAALEEALS